jgi:hypothetical protein
MFITRTPALIAASCLAIAGGGTGAALLASSAQASSSGAPAGQTGTATVSVTGPAGKTRTRTVPVSCMVTDGSYVVKTSRQHGKRSRTETLTVPDYTGAGSYTATVVIARHTAHSFSERNLKVPATLTSDGGSVSYSKTLTGKHHSKLKGKTISAKATWTCSPTAGA